MATDDTARPGENESSYDAQDITVLEGLEAVRKRPGMYIGSTGERGLHHLIYEIVDNAVDEALAGRNDAAEITIHPDNSVTVVDAGRGIPVATMEKEGKSALEVVLTVLHAGGKFGDGGGYKVSGGLHGVGLSVVNALSERLDAEVRRDGFVWRQSFTRGVPAGSMQRGEATTETGTTISFLPDHEVFETLEINYRTIEERLRDTAFLTRGMRILIVDERGEGHRAEFQYEGGIVDFVAFLNQNKDPIQKKIISIEGRVTRARSRSRCSGTPPTTSRCSPSPTTSTRSRVARTCPGSARPSPARSTATPRRRGCSRRRTRRCRVTTSARA